MPTSVAERTLPHNLEAERSVLGAILLTGYLGGAVATNVRAEQPLFNIVFPVIFAAIAWAGLWLREARLGELLPLKK